jgi:hypothetical protein
METTEPSGRRAMQAAASQLKPSFSLGSVGARASASPLSHSLSANTSLPLRKAERRPPAPRTATRSAFALISTSGCGAPNAITMATTTSKSPLHRSLERSKQIRHRPAVAANSAPMPNAGMRPTAPGRLATQSATTSIHSIPCPIACQSGPSKPNGMAARASKPAGITHTETIGIASKLAMTPYGASR